MRALDTLPSAASGTGAASPLCTSGRTQHLLPPPPAAHQPRPRSPRKPAPERELSGHARNAAPFAVLEQHSHAQLPFQPASSTGSLRAAHSSRSSSPSPLSSPSSLAPHFLPPSSEPLTLSPGPWSFAFSRYLRLPSRPSFPSRRWKVSQILLAAGTINTLPRRANPESPATLTNLQLHSYRCHLSFPRGPFNKVFPSAPASRCGDLGHVEEFRGVGLAALAWKSACPTPVLSCAKRSAAAITSLRAVCRRCSCFP